MQHFTFNLPVKRYIQKYITSIYGDTVPAGMDTDIGFVVLNVLSSNLQGKIWRGYLDLWANRYNGNITFTVPFHYFYLTKREISPFTCSLLNRYFENRFEEDLFKFVELYGSGGYGKRKKAIEDFTIKHNIQIEEDITMDAMIKIEYRRRKKNIDKSLRELSDSKNLFSQACA